MAGKYLLPCYCGRQIVVERSQAGENVVCSCGASLQVPNLLQMKMLEEVSEPTEQIRRTWEWRERLRLLGIILFIVSILGLGLLLWFRPRNDPFAPEEIQRAARALAPADTWENWERMKQGLDRRIDKHYAAAMEKFRIWSAVSGVVGLSGLALIAAGLLPQCGKPR